MRATWPTARKSEPEPGASAGARLRNRSGDNRMNRLSLFFCGRGAPDAPCPAHVAAPGAAGLGRGIFRRGVPFAFRAALGSGPPPRGGDAGWSVRPSECAGGGVFLPGFFRCRRPSFPDSFLSPVPSAIVLLSPVPSAGSALLFPVPVRAARFFGKKMRWGEINAIFAPKSSEA